MARTFDRQLTDAYKQIIRSEQLIDTGTFIDTVKVYSEVLSQPRIIRIAIVAVDYHRYLHDRYALIDKLADTRQFQDTITRLTADFIEERVFQFLSGEFSDFSDNELQMKVELDYFEF